MLAALLIALTLSAPDGGSAQAAPPKVAVATLTPGLGVDQKLCDVVTDSLVAALQQRGLRVFSARELQAMLGFERQKALLGCTDDSCMAELSGATGAERFVSGSLARVGDSLVFSAQVTDTRSGEVLHRHQLQRANAKDDAFLADVPSVANDLFPETAPASVRQPEAAAGAKAAPPEVAAAKTAPAPGATRTEPKSLLAFSWHPGGRVWLGCVAGDADCEGLETPREHGMGGFWLAQTETTVAAYETCVRAGACPAVAARKQQRPLCTAGGAQAGHPQNCVTFPEAQGFCQWMGGRLPSASEFEYAAKSGGRQRFPWGNAQASPSLANYCEGCDGGGRLLRGNEKAARRAARARGQTLATEPVGSHPEGKNAFGALDLAGNVREWTSTGLPNGAIDTRGGSFLNRPNKLRASARQGMLPDHWEPDVGFRCVLQP